MATATCSAPARRLSSLRGLRRCHGRFGLRPLQDRHRPQQFPHRGPDAGGSPVRARASSTRESWRPRQRICGSDVRLARRHRQGPRHRQGGACSACSATSPTRSRSTTSALRCKRGTRMPSGSRCWARHEIGFNEKTDLILYRRETLPFHANGMRFTAFDAEGAEVAAAAPTTRSAAASWSAKRWRTTAASKKVIAPDTTVLAHPFHSGLPICWCSRPSKSCSIAETHAPQRAALANRRRDRRRTPQDLGR